MFIAKTQRYIRKAYNVVIYRAPVAKYDICLPKTKPLIYYFIKYFKLFIG